MYSIKNKRINYNEIKIENELNQKLENLQKEKSNNLINIGIFLYEKIRKHEVYYTELENEYESIKNIDKEIYEINIKLNKEKINKNLECDCGSIIRLENKFCPECGKKIELDEENIILCSRCNTENNIEYSFCVCCGNNMKEIL